ncbi:helix-turn-helix domain-containing protein [Corticicoccus populi]|uniref:Helix-turn-helix domain-containing protein n=1 Tax=Corticicoccus populi TaxID=1812821 RepID=A0ABW5WW82_9STAP
MTLGQRIRTLRKEKKLTQTDLAGDRITKNMLSIIENDKSDPSLETLNYLAKKLGVPVSYLTQEGDEAWTREIFKKLRIYDDFNYPEEVVQNEIIPNMDKISQTETGVRVYLYLRGYFRRQYDDRKADDISSRIYDYYNRLGLEHLAVKDKIDDAVSYINQYNYEKTFNKLLDLYDEVEVIAETVPEIKLEYYFMLALFSVSIDEAAFVKYSREAIGMCHKLQSFKNYLTLNNLMSCYYGLLNDSEYQYYFKKIKSYIDFNDDPKYDALFLNKESPVTLKFLLVEDEEKERLLLKDYLERNKESEFKFLEFYLPIFQLELYYFSGEYEKVLKEFKKEYYHRHSANHQVDRMTIAIRQCVYPLCLYYLGEKSKAVSEFDRIEREVKDISHMIFAKELYEIKEIINQ